MRHVWSLIGGVVVAFAGWLALGVVYGLFEGQGTTQQEKYIAVAIFVVAGLLYGAGGSLRNSPVGALFVSLAYFGISIGPMVGAYSAITLGEWSLGDYRVDWVAPVPILAVVAATLFMSIFSPSRWRGNAAQGDPNAWTPPPPPAPWSPPSTFPPDSSAAPTAEIRRDDDTKTDKLY